MVIPSSIVMFPVLVVSPHGLNTAKGAVEDLLWAWNGRYSQSQQTCMLPVNPAGATPSECDLMVVLLRSDLPILPDTVETVLAYTATNQNLLVCVSQRKTTSGSVEALLEGIKGTATVIPILTREDFEDRLVDYITETGSVFAKETRKTLGEPSVV